MKIKTYIKGNRTLEVFLRESCHENDGSHFIPPRWECVDSTGTTREFSDWSHVSMFINQNMWELSQ